MLPDRSPDAQPRQMSQALALPRPHSLAPPRIRINWDPPFFLGLIAPAVLLGFLRMWAFFLAPRYGVYFTSELVLVAYAYFALARAVFMHHRGHDRDGKYDRARALKADQDFHRECRARLPGWAACAAPAFALTILADVLTKGWGKEWLYLALLVVLAVEIRIWMRFGPAFIVGCAKWSPPAPIAFGEARRLVETNKLLVKASFLVPTLIFFAVAIGAISIYRRLGAFIMSLVPDPSMAFYYAVSFFAVLAGLALWLNCRWSWEVLLRLRGPLTLEEVVNAGRDLRRNPRLKRLLSPPAKRR
jgi:hypothetical protein